MSEAANRRIALVIGSNETIGSAVVRRLDRKAPAPPPPGCVRIPSDIASDESVREPMGLASLP